MATRVTPAAGWPALSPAVLARAAGALYLAIFLLAPFAEFVVRESLVVAGDPAATARNILAAEGTFRAAFLGDLVVFTIEVAQAAILYVLLRPAGRTLALVMAFARLAQAAVLGLNLLNMHTALSILTTPEYAAAFAPGQLHALAAIFLTAQRAGYDLGLVFFALHLTVLGHLIFHSGFLPRAIGALIGVSAIGYALNSAAVFLAPALAGLTGSVVLVTALAGDLPLTIWLLVKGVDGSRWQARADTHEL